MRPGPEDPGRGRGARRRPPHRPSRLARALPGGADVGRGTLPDVADLRRVGGPHPGPSVGPGVGARPGRPGPRRGAPAPGGDRAGVGPGLGVGGRDAGVRGGGAGPAPRAPRLAGTGAPPGPEGPVAGEPARTLDGTRPAAAAGGRPVRDVGGPALRAPPVAGRGRGGEGGGPGPARRRPDRRPAALRPLAPRPPLGGTALFDRRGRRRARPPAGDGRRGHRGLAAAGPRRARPRSRAVLRVPPGTDVGLDHRPRPGRPAIELGGLRRRRGGRRRAGGRRTRRPGLLRRRHRRPGHRPLRGHRRAGLVGRGRRPPRRLRPLTGRRLRQRRSGLPEGPPPRAVRGGLGGLPLGDGGVGRGATPRSVDRPRRSDRRRDRAGPDPRRRGVPLPRRRRGRGPRRPVRRGPGGNRHLRGPHGGEAAGVRPPGRGRRGRRGAPARPPRPPPAPPGPGRPPPFGRVRTAGGGRPPRAGPGAAVRRRRGPGRRVGAVRRPRRDGGRPARRPVPRRAPRPGGRPAGPGPAPQRPPVGAELGRRDAGAAGARRRRAGGPGSGRRAGGAVGGRRRPAGGLGIRRLAVPLRGRDGAGPPRGDRDDRRHGVDRGRGGRPVRDRPGLGRPAPAALRARRLRPRAAGAPPRSAGRARSSWPRPTSRPSTSWRRRSPRRVPGAWPSTA